MKDDGIVIKYKPTDSNSGNHMKINMMNDGLKMTHKDDNGEKNITIGSDDIEINYDGNVEITGEEIHLNGADNHATLWEGFKEFVDVFRSHSHTSACGGTIGLISSPNPASAKSKSVKLK